MTWQLQQTDTSTGGDGGTVQCGAGANPFTKAFRIASKTGTPGVGTPAPALLGIKTGNQHAVYSETPAGEPGLTVWNAGDYVYRLNVTMGNANLTWVATYVCRVDASSGNLATVGSLTGQTTSLTATGVKTHTISGSSQIANSGDRLYFVLVFANASALVQSFNFTPDQLIDTPLAAAVVAGAMPRPVEVIRLRRPLILHGPAQPQPIFQTPPLIVLASPVEPLPSYRWPDPIILHGPPPTLPIVPLRPMVILPPEDLAWVKHPPSQITRGIPPPAAVVVQQPLVVSPWDDFSWRKHPDPVMVRGLTLPPANADYFIVSLRKAGVLFQLRIALNNFQATTDPTVGSDASLGYGPGSLWVNKTLGKAWVCTSATVGGANWVQIG